MILFVIYVLVRRGAPTEWRPYSFRGVGVLGAVFVKVYVRVSLTVVRVLMYMNVRAPAQCPDQCRQTKTNDHQRYAEFQPVRNSFRNCYAQHKHNCADKNQRYGVSYAPQSTDNYRSKNVALLADYRRDGNDVVYLGGVFESKHESQT